MGVTEMFESENVRTAVSLLEIITVIIMTAFGILWGIRRLKEINEVKRVANAARETYESLGVEASLPKDLYGQILVGKHRSRDSVGFCPTRITD